VNRRLFGPTILTLLLVLASPAHGQRAALTASGGWKFGGSTRVQVGELNSAASEHYGLELAVRVRRDASGILLVDYQPTKLRLESGGLNSELFDLDVWYVMLGGQVELIDRGPVVPFAIGTLGIAWFNPTGASAADRGSDTSFAGMFGGGARVPLGQSGKVSLRLEGRMYLTIPWGGASLYCGGGGCYGGIGGTIGPVQGTAMAGLRFALGS